MTMNHPLNRALLLYQHSRYSEAEQELRRLLAEHPHDPQAHALLGLCLVKQDKLDEAQAETEQAITLAPDWPHSHYCRSVVLEHRRRFAESEASAREAVRLDPADADNYARLAATLFNQSKWPEALATAEEGLAYDAEHAGCGNLRTMALTKLGRKQEAIATVDQTLARDPDDAFAHANKGWALLHEGKPRPALEHFREALRLDPTFEYARQGMVEALKAHNPIYRWMLAYFLWMSRLSDRARWGVILGGWFLIRILRNTARGNPELETWTNPIIAVYAVFVLLTWFSIPLFNLLLRLSRYGRHALSEDQRRGSNGFGACLLAFVACVIAAYATDNPAPGAAAFIFVGLALPMASIFMVERGWPRTTLSILAGAMAIAGLTSVTAIGLGQDWGFPFLIAFIIGFLVTPWLVNYLATVTVRR
jgi:tetratricopeptide (TPR) repeat protein